MGVESFLAPGSSEGGVAVDDQDFGVRPDLEEGFGACEAAPSCGVCRQCGVGEEVLGFLVQTCAYYDQIVDFFGWRLSACAF